MTSERTLPALEAAHIQRYSHGGDHSLSNGLLLRSDLHKLFDLGYVTVNPTSMTIEVSRKIREEFENGRDYYRLQGQPLAEPQNPLALPSKTFGFTTKMSFGANVIELERKEPLRLRLVLIILLTEQDSLGLWLAEAECDHISYFD